MFNKKKRYLKKYCDNLLEVDSKKDLKKLKKDYKKDKKKSYKKRKGCLLFILFIFLIGRRKDK